MVLELQSSKEIRVERLPKKDIRSGREYYEGWDKYVTHCEKESNIEEKFNKDTGTKEVYKEALMDPVAQKKKRIGDGLEAKPLVERQWLANREREKGNDLFKAKEFNSSLQAYTKAISMHKENATLYANRAAVYLKMNRHEEAYADCTETLKLDPQNVKAFMRRAKASLEMNEPFKALNDLNEALKFDSTNEEILGLKRNAEGVLKNASNMTYQGSLPGGRRLAVEEVEDIATEINELKKPAEKEERKESMLIADEWRVKGNTLFAEGEFQKACDCYSKSLTHVSDNATVLCNRSLCQLKLKNYKEAEMDASKALALDSSFIKAFHHRGLARSALGMLESATDDLKEVLKAIPGDKSVASELNMMAMELNSGRLLLPKREGPMIIEEIHEDIAQSPVCKKNVKSNSSGSQPSSKNQGLQENTVVSNTTEGMADGHMLKSFMKNSSGPVQTSCKVQNLQESSVTIQTSCGDATQVQVQEHFNTDNSSHVKNDSEDQDYSQTKFCSSDVRSRSSTALQASNGEHPENQHMAVQKRLRGNEYFKSGEYVQAIDCYNESLELDQTVTATYTNRALCHLRLKEPENAIDDCTQAILLEPQNSKAYYRRAASKQQIEDHIGALEDFKMFMSLCPGDRSVERLIKELESKLHRQSPVSGMEETVAKQCDTSDSPVKVNKLNTTKVSEILQNPDKWRTSNALGTPKSALEFERSCLDLLKQPFALKEYMHAIKTELYPVIFKEDLTARILKLVAVFVKENITLFEFKEIFDILEGFTRVKRFEIVVMFLEPCAKEVVRELFEHLAATTDPGVEIKGLRCKYLC